jgi:DNA-binding Lrp family transcriptional regulator
MDCLNRQLLALLRADARTSIAQLAKMLDVSRATVRNRIRHLEKSGLITGYTVCLRPDAQTDGITAWMSIAIEGDKTRDVVALLRREPAITSLHDTNGRWDLLAEVRTPTIAELSQVLERVRKIRAIGTTETSIHLQTFR